MARRLEHYDISDRRLLMRSQADRPLRPAAEFTLARRPHATSQSRSVVSTLLAEVTAAATVLAQVGGWLRARHFTCPGAGLSAGWIHPAAAHPPSARRHMR
jgi:hypothetical protein